MTHFQADAEALLKSAQAQVDKVSKQSILRDVPVPRPPLRLVLAALRANPHAMAPRLHPQRLCQTPNIAQLGRSHVRLIFSWCQLAYNSSTIDRMNGQLFSPKVRLDVGGPIKLQLTFAPQLSDATPTMKMCFLLKIE